MVLLGQQEGQSGRLDLGDLVDAELLSLLQPQPHAQLLGGQVASSKAYWESRGSSCTNRSPFFTTLPRSMRVSITIPEALLPTSDFSSAPGCR